MAVSIDRSMRRAISPGRSISAEDTSGLLQPRHPFAQFNANLLDRVLEILVEQTLIFLTAPTIFGDPLAGEFTAPDLLQNGTHHAFGAGIDDPGAAREIAIFGSLADELMHFRQAALMEQIDDELELMQALVIGDFGLIAGLDQGFETLDDEFRGAAAEYRLL